MRKPLFYYFLLGVGVLVGLLLLPAVFLLITNWEDEYLRYVIGAVLLFGLCGEYFLILTLKTFHIKT